MRNRTYLMVKILIGFFLFGVSLVRAEGSLDVTNLAVLEAFSDGAIKQAMKKHHSPSGVVVVMKGGQIVFQKGYGYQDMEKRIPVSPKTTLFRPGSVSKLFTWVAVMQQVEKGTLDLDTDVNQYLKTFQVKDTWPGKPVTLRHIMTHTAGFEDGGLGYLIKDNPDAIIPLAESLAKYEPTRVNPPGIHAAYSNWATALAGLIVSNAAGMPFNDYIQQNIFDILGMRNASFSEPLPTGLQENMAKGYSYSGGAYVEKPYEIISNFGPAGALAVSGYDMSLFARALLGGGVLDGKRILKAETLQQMLDEGFSYDDRIRGMGLGFFKNRLGYEGLESFGHDGATLKFITHFGLSKTEDFMLFVSFSGPGAYQTLTTFAYGFYDAFFPPEVPQVAPPANFAERAEKFAGTYNSWRENFSTIESLFRILGGKTVSPAADNTLLIDGDRYVEVDTNLFREVDGNKRVAFQENNEGEVTGYIVDGLGDSQMFRAAFYEGTVFNGLFVGVSAIVFLGVILRLAYQFSSVRAGGGAEKSAHYAAISVAVSNLLFLLFFAVGVTSLSMEIPFLIKFSLVFPLLATICMVFLVHSAVKVWRQGLLGGTLARVRYSIVALSALFMTWFYYYWNLLGFNYYS